MIPIDFMIPAQALATDEFFCDVLRRRLEPSVVLSSVFGRGCLAANSKFGIAPNGAVVVVERFAEELLARQDSGALGLDPLPFIELQRLFRRLDVAAPMLDRVSARVADALSHQPREVLSHGHARLISSRLNSAGHAVSVTTPQNAMAEMMVSAEHWFDLPGDKLGDLADHLLADERPLGAEFVEVLGLICLAELRNYRLDVACKILRTLIGLGVRNEQTEDALTFIALQRRQDGSYGFVSPLQKAAASGPEADFEGRFHVPTTLTAVWLFSMAGWRHAVDSSLKG